MRNLGRGRQGRYGERHLGGRRKRSGRLREFTGRAGLDAFKAAGGVGGTGAFEALAGLIRVSERKRRMRAQIDQASTGRAGEPGPPVADHGQGGEGSDKRHLEQRGERGVARRRTEGGRLRIVAVADETDAHGSHAGGTPARTEHDSGSNHCLGADESDRQGREVHEPGGSHECAEDEQVNDVGTDEA